jgi:hypothetical protein
LVHCSNHKLNNWNYKKNFSVINIAVDAVINIAVDIVDISILDMNITENFTLHELAYLLV